MKLAAAALVVLLASFPLAQGEPEFTLNIIHPNSQAFGFEGEEDLGNLAKHYKRIESIGARVLFVATTPSMRLSSIKNVTIAATIGGRRSVVVALPDKMREILRGIRLSPKTSQFALMTGEGKLLGTVRTVSISIEECRFNVPVATQENASALYHDLSALIDND